MSHHFPATSYAFTPFTDAQNWIDGHWCTPSGATTNEVVNPRWARSMGNVTFSTADDVDAAVRAAQAAYADWKQWPVRDRAQIFYNLRQLMHDNLEELTWLVSHENGKTYPEARAEVLKAIECVEFGCSLPNIAAGQQLDVSRGVNCQVIYESLGVVAGVTPFNFPLMVPLWMLPQALVAGNTFILKPSEQVPLSVIRLADLFQQAGLPKGVLNVVQGGQEAVEALCDHPGIDALAFVGSTRVAKIVYGRACATGKRTLCLGGAKNHLIVVPDADVEVTADNVVASFTGCAGQRCMAASVMVAVGDVDHIIDAIADRARNLQTGQDMGAITNESSVHRITNYIDQAEEMGATVVLDGRNCQPNEDGYWVGPTLIDHVTPDMPASHQEIFGPVLSIVRVPHVDAALALENNNPYGNASAVYTTSGDIARKVILNTEAGMCGINIGVPVPREPFGFGGWNDSKFGHGNITGWDGYRFWTRPRKITTKWALQSDQNWMS